MRSTEATEARKSLSKGARPPVTAKDLADWEGRWAPVLRDVFGRDVDETFSEELAARLEGAVEARRPLFYPKAEYGRSVDAEVAEDTTSPYDQSPRPLPFGLSEAGLRGLSEGGLRNIARRQGIGGVDRMSRSQLLAAISRSLRKRH